MKKIVTNIKENKPFFKNIFFAVLFALVVSNLVSEWLKSLLSNFISAMLPIVLAGFLAYFLKNAVQFFEQKVYVNFFNKSRKVKKTRRFLALVTVFLILACIISLLFVIVIPSSITKISDLVNNSSQYIEKISSELLEFFTSFKIVKKLNLENSIINAIGDFTSNLQGYFPKLLDKLLLITSQTSVFILNLLIALVLAFFMIKEKEKITKFFKRILYANYNTSSADKIVGVFDKINTSLSSYFTGKFLEASIVFACLLPGFFVLKVPDGVLIALIVAVINFIPYVGMIIGLVPIAVFTLIFASVNTAVVAVLYALIMLTLINSFVSPFIFGKKLNISTFVVVLSILIGGAIFSFWGMLFAPPVASVLSIVIEENLIAKEKLKLIMKSYGVKEEDKAEKQIKEVIKKAKEKNNKKT